MNVFSYSCIHVLTKSDRNRNRYNPIYLIRGSMIFDTLSLNVGILFYEVGHRSMYGVQILNILIKNLTSRVRFFIYKYLTVGYLLK